MTSIRTMTIQAKSILILLGTLVIGGLLGGAIVGMISQNRKVKRADIQGPGGFVRHLERIIEIEDSTQHAIIHPILEKTDARNREILRESWQSMKLAYDSMMVELEQKLTKEQLKRLVDENERVRNQWKNFRNGQNKEQGQGNPSPQNPSPQNPSPQNPPPRK